MNDRLEQPLLQVRGLVRRFGGLVAVDGLSFTVGAGELVGLLGPNGSGKSTAINLISGVFAPDAGAVLLDGQPITGWAPHRVARAGIARTFQLVRVLPSLTLAENVQLAVAFHAGGARQTGANARDWLKRVGLADKAQSQPSELTYIDQKRLELARALALQPRLLMLDEWLAGLNPTELQQAIALVRSLAAEGIAILMVEHVMEAVRALCSRAVVMHHGRVIAQGPTAQVLADPEVLRCYLGEEVTADV
ncbi:ABC transporter ATP-binding protein [Xenophilus sp. Marseille-Q4582]|uniref:ABC transporter ATP-binding protein n=1 Tax=Xenophilus sp. Marseille-Q4582 TaxID=2866600 RepID=UPI001CE3C387|nr:ABC transporter ATP-binding protein [Xenophilus sp. Marseille-Q4582]